MSKYVGAVDQGTTSTRFMIFDHSGKVVAFDQKEHEQIFPKPGWVEHNAIEIWERTQDVIRGALAKAAASSFEGLIEDSMNPDSRASDGAIQGSSSSRNSTVLRGLAGAGLTAPGSALNACWCSFISRSKNALVCVAG